jgi:hypothetical protein
MVEAVLDLKRSGDTDREASVATGVPIHTIRGRRRRGVPRERPRKARCSECGGAIHDWAALPPETYAYVLGVYLGDGHLRPWRNAWTLRVSLDNAHPGIIAECAHALEEMCGKPPKLGPHHSGSNCTNVDSTMKEWSCLLPQHGPGRKHTRPIVLTDWQQEIVNQAPGMLLRGLIHTDGWRGVNKVHVKGKDYEYPRYQFSNRSDDIRRIFTETCEMLGIEWRQWTRYHVSVAKRESVALLDTFVGEKY